ncbi:MAG: hypothetical protein ACYSWU_24320, partial [Planctomycetota bacterium]
MNMSLVTASLLVMSFAGSADAEMPADFLEVESKAWSRWLDEDLDVSWHGIPLKDVLAHTFGAAAFTVDDPEALGTPITFDASNMTRRASLWRISRRYGFTIRWAQKDEPRIFMGLSEAEQGVAADRVKDLRDDTPKKAAVLPDKPSTELVTELTSWRNHTEQTVRTQLGQPIHTELYTNGVPNFGVSEFVEDKVKRQHPDYQGAVKHLRWFSEPNYYDVFFVDKDNQ